MPGFKQAFLWASAGRYSVVLISVATTVIMARLISPGEYGLLVLGTIFYLLPTPSATWPGRPISEVDCQRCDR